MVDTRLPFGARFSPGIFHELTQAVKYILQQQGHNGIVVYLDDFLVIEPTKEKCLDTLNTLIALVRKLGFCVAWNKVQGPTTCLTFLGVELDSRKMEMRLPTEKVEKFCALLDTFVERKRASLRQCQELAGKLNWAIQVVRAGRIYLRRIFEAISKMKASHHKIVLTADIKSDLLWWKYIMTNFNGVRTLHDGPDHRVFISANDIGGDFRVLKDGSGSIKSRDVEGEVDIPSKD